MNIDRDVKREIRCMAIKLLKIDFISGEVSIHKIIKTLKLKYKRTPKEKWLNDAKNFLSYYYVKRG